MTERVLIVKLAALGDVIMASTLVPAIRTRWPDAVITFVTSEGLGPLVRLFDGIDRVVTVNERALFTQGRLSAVKTVVGAWRDLGRNHDLALVGHTDKRYRTLAWMSGARESRLFAAGRGPRRAHWHGAEYLRLLDANTSDPAPPYASIRTTELPPPPGVAGTGPLVVIAPGGGRNVLRDDPLRRWPITLWTEAVQALRSRGCRVVAVGGASDAVEGAECAAAGAVNLTGRTSLLELTSLIHSADVVVTHDSGTLHLALLLKRPTVALFGPTVPNERIANGAPVIVLSRADELPCAPCYDGLGYADCARNLCLTRVPVAELIAAVADQLDLDPPCAFQA